MFGIIAKIMAEVLSVFSLVTKQIKQGRLSMLFPLTIFALFVTSARKICQETVGRERDRRRAP
jgi:hypothetical protein